MNNTTEEIMNRLNDGSFAERIQQKVHGDVVLKLLLRIVVSSPVSNFPSRTARRRIIGEKRANVIVTAKNRSNSGDRTSRDIGSDRRDCVLSEGVVLGGDGGS